MVTVVIRTPLFFTAGQMDGLFCLGPGDGLPTDMQIPLSPPRTVRFGPTQLTFLLAPGAELIRSDVRLTGRSTI